MQGDQAVMLDDEIDVLDLVVPLAESWRLWLGGTVLASVLAFVGATLWPKTYESSSSMGVPTANIDPLTGQTAAQWTADKLVALMQSRPFLAQVAEAVGETANRTEELEAFAKRLTVTKDRSNAFVTVKTRAETPQAARTLNDAVLATLAAATRPAGERQQRLEALLQQERESLQKTLRLQDTLTQRLAQAQGADAEVLAKALLETTQIAAEQRQRVSAAEQELAGLGKEYVLAQPDTPSKPVSPRRGLLTAVAMVAAAMGLALFIWARAAWRGAAQRPDQAEKIRRIHAALRLTPPTPQTPAG